MAQYSFPVLENDELLPCLEEMELPLSALDLAKPTYEIVRPLYENMLTTLTGITREELMQPVFTAIDAFEFPELHDESIPCLHFYRQLHRLMAVTGVRDFSMRDVYKPEALRLRRHLSAVVNFAKFREEKLAAYADSQGVMDAALEERRALEEANLAWVRGPPPLPPAAARFICRRRCARCLPGGGGPRICGGPPGGEPHASRCGGAPRRGWPAGGCLPARALPAPTPRASLPTHPPVHPRCRCRS